MIANVSRDCGGYPIKETAGKVQGIKWRANEEK